MAARSAARSPTTSRAAACETAGARARDGGKRHDLQGRRGIRAQFPTETEVRFSLEAIEVFFLYADEGVLGSLTGISSNLLMIVILFAAFMLHSGFPST